MGLPLVLVLEDESRIVQQEKEMLAQQQGAQAVSRAYATKNASLLTGNCVSDDGCAVPT